MATTNAEGTITTITREEEIAAVRVALSNVLGNAADDLSAAAEAVVNEMDRIATDAYVAHLSSGGTGRGLISTRTS